MPNNRLKQLREERKLSQKDVANKLNIPPTTYSGYENNKREPNSEMLINLADFFNCSIDYLIGRSNKRINDSVLDNVPHRWACTASDKGGVKCRQTNAESVLRRNDFSKQDLPLEMVENI